MVVTLSGRSIEVRLVQPAKVESNVVRPLGKSTVVSAEQDKNVRSRVVIPSGRLAVVRAEHPQKVCAPKVVTELGRVMLRSAVKLRNTWSPIVVTPSGMVIEVTVVRGPTGPDGLPSPVMALTGNPSISLGMVMEVGVPEQLVIVTEVPSVVYVRFSKVAASAKPKKRGERINKPGLRNLDNFMWQIN
jgi:hypothetical protein